MVVIAGCGGYVPLYRVERETIAAQHGGRGRGESAVPARDENHVTMACEAAGTAFARAGLGGGEGRDLGAVFSASVTDPLAEHGIAAHVAYRLDATGDVRTGDFRATARASTDALFAARAFVEATGERALVVASDVLPAEPGDDGEANAGAGAGAVVLAPDDGANVDATDTPTTDTPVTDTLTPDARDAPAATLAGWGQETTGFVERHREHGAPAVGGDVRFERRYGARPAAEVAAERALAAGGIEAPARAVACAPDARLARTVLGGVEAEHVSTFDAVGSAGTASLLLDLTHLLETTDPGTPALAVCYGAGGADAVALEVGDGAGRGGDVDGGGTVEEDEASRGGPTVAELLDAKEYVTYAKHLEYREPVEYQGVNRA